MHTEHLQNVRVSWVLFGWFVSVAVMSAIVLGLVAVGVLSPDPTAGGAGWGVAAIATGFLAGGWLTGARVQAAPILHGVGIGLVSLLVWFVANAFFASWLGLARWGESPASASGMLILQMAAATVGARLAVRRGEPPEG